MKSKKIKVVCAIVAASMLMNGSPNYIYATEMGEDSSINSEEEVTETENDDTNYIDEEVQDIEPVTAPEGYIP